MNRQRTYSRQTLAALALLAKQIKLGRKQHCWTENELAERAGVSRATLQKIEKGDPGCAIGLVLEVAVLAGVPLFDTDIVGLSQHGKYLSDTLALLPKAVRASPKPVDDDF